MLQISIALLVCLGSWAILEVGLPGHSMHPDTHEDLGIVRQCLELGQCPTGGATTSIDGLDQGALWLNLLTSMRGFGLSIQACKSVTLIFAGLGIALFFLVCLRRFSQSISLFSALVMLFFLEQSGSLRILWNPSLMPFPITLLFCANLLYLNRPTWSSMGAVSLAMALALETHPVMLLLAVPATLSVGLSAQRTEQRFTRVFLTIAMAVALLALMSPLALRINAQHVLETLGPFGLLATGAAVLGTVSLGGSAWLRLSTLAKEMWLSCATVSVVVAACLVQHEALSQNGPFGVRYVLGAIPAFAYLAGYVLYRFFGGLSRTHLILVCLLGLVIANGATNRRAETLSDGSTLLGLDDLETVARQADSLGLDLDTAWAGLNGHFCSDYLAALAIIGLPVVPEDSRLVEHDLYLIPAASGRGTSADWPGHWQAVPGAKAVLGRMKSWVRRNPARVCAYLDGLEEPRCEMVDLRRGFIATAPPEFREHFDRWDPPTHNLEILKTDRDRALRLTYEVRVDIPATSGRRRFRLNRTSAPDAQARDSIIAVEGLRFEGSLPARTLVFISANTPQRGKLILQRKFGGAVVGPFFTPCFHELPPDAPADLVFLMDPTNGDANGGGQP
jgi:hypothetical protein